MGVASSRSSTNDVGVVCDSSVDMCEASSSLGYHDILVSSHGCLV